MYFFHTITCPIVSITIQRPKVLRTTCAVTMNSNCFGIDKSQSTGNKKQSQKARTLNFSHNSYLGKQFKTGFAILFSLLNIHYLIINWQFLLVFRFYHLFSLELLEAQGITLK